jgi:hypothetical protein
MTVYNTLREQEVLELIGYVLPTFIILQCLDFASKVILSISLEHSECLECLTLALHVKTHFEASMIINEGNTISPTLSGEDLVFLQIRVIQIKRRFSTMSSGRKRSCIQLACKSQIGSGFWFEVIFAPVTSFLLRIV